MAFKVKTTAPKQYCVRPNSGRIDPGSDVEVQVLLQAMKEDPPPDQKCRDKFLVQSVIVPADKDLSNIPSVWSSIEQTNKASIQEKKIRVNFLPADATTTTPAARVNGVSNRDQTPSQFSTASEPATPSYSTNAVLASVGTPESRQRDNNDISDTTRSAVNQAPNQGPLQQTAQRVASAIPVSTEDLKTQLAEAQAQITNLKGQLAEQTGLRQRKTATEKSSTDAPSGMQQVQQQADVTGVPIQWVAILCLISFLIAYLLF